MEPHPEQEDRPEARTNRLGVVIGGVVIGAVVLLVIVLHLTGVISPGGHS